MPGATETEFFQRADMMNTKVGTDKKDDAAEVTKNGFAAMMKGEGGVSGLQKQASGSRRPCHTRGDAREAAYQDGGAGNGQEVAAKGTEGRKRVKDAFNAEHLTMICFAALA